MSLLSRCFGCLRSRGFWILIGLIIVSYLIWAYGSLFAFGESRPLEPVWARVTLIGLIILFFLLRFIIGRWRAARMNERIANLLRPAEHASPGDDAGGVGVLRDRFSDAMGVLRTARFEKTQPSLWSRITRHGRYVYELPWYIIIGAPGVGKTTALLNSGLSFPLAKQFGASSIRGAGGTRDCDWWFTNDAVFIDTAGRYTTHESDARADKAEWLGFLSLLKKYRTQQPINGALLVVSVAELLGVSREDRINQAAIQRRRLDELRNDLGTTFPVYLLVNKCDLLLGFDEYFSSLDHSGRDQVWGFTLPLASSGKLDLSPETFSKEFEALRERVSAGLVDNLQAEPDLGRRELMFTFPDQFEVLTHTLREMLPELFSDSRYSNAPFLRGIYFTSATQEGTPFDRIVHVLGQDLPARRVTKAAAPGEGKAYFLSELLMKVVFPEAHIGSSDRKAARRSRAFHIGAYAFCVLALCGVILAWATSYRNNTSYIAEVESKTANFGRELATLPTDDKSKADINTLLPMLDSAEALPDSAFFKATDPMLDRRLGLYQGKKLQAGSRPLYQGLLKQWFAPAVKANLEHWLRTVDFDNTNFAYEVLKAYVMMHEPEHFKEEEFVKYVDAIWAHDYPAGELAEQRKDLARHLKALIAMGAVTPATPMDKGLVETTRSRIVQYSPSQRIYRRILGELKEPDLPDFSVADEVGDMAARVFRRKSGGLLSRGVPALYTYRGYHELFDKNLDRVAAYLAQDEAWVLDLPDTGSKKVGAELKLDVKKLYMHEYVAQWDKYIADVTLITPNNLPEVAEQARILSQDDSPLFVFMKGVARETTLTPKVVPEQNARPNAVAQTVRNQVAGAVGIGTSDLNNILAPESAGRSPDAKGRPELIVDNHFADLHRAVGDGSAGSASRLMAVLKGFNDLYIWLNGAMENRLRGIRTPPSTVPSQLMSEAASLPSALRGLLVGVISAGENHVKKANTDVTGDSIRGNVTTICRERIAGRYPVAVSNKEITPGDFGAFFGPNGVMESYFQQNLASDTDTSARPWRLRPSPQGLGGNARGALDAFEKARAIKDAFFRDGGNEPGITFSITPVKMDQTITALTLDIDGVVIKYRHGAPSERTVKWPGSHGGQKVTLTVDPPLPEGQGVNSVSMYGKWAIYRFFDSAMTIVPGNSPERFRVVFNVGGRAATFDVVGSSVKNPLRLSELKNFRCPTGL